MTLTFVTNFVHHHQLPIADEFYKILGGDYHYIVTSVLSESLKQGGYDPNIFRDYLIYSFRSMEDMNRARRLIDESDVVIVGAAPMDWVIKRQKENKVTFHYSERWLKNHVWKNYLPWNLKKIWNNYGRFRNKRVYLLCASAFAASDARRFGCFPHKSFKWGYFTSVDSSFSVSEQKEDSAGEGFKLMWCARFIELKHPELPIYLASRLKKRGYKFRLDMYGSGVLYDTIKEMAQQLDVADVVSFCGNVPNTHILDSLRQHDIFLFTSDRNEGWGAVLNEAMSNGCAVVASHEIGAVPYLIKDGVNGLVFKSKSIDSLEKKVLSLLNDHNKCHMIRKEAVLSMQKMWAPSIAANAFLCLAERALENDIDSYKNFEGPASWA